jgi:hypothetical protein
VKRLQRLLKHVGIPGFKDSPRFWCDGWCREGHHGANREKVTQALVAGGRSGFQHSPDLPLTALSARGHNFSQYANGGRDLHMGQWSQILRRLIEHLGSNIPNIIPKNWPKSRPILGLCKCGLKGRVVKILAGV